VAAALRVSRHSSRLALTSESRRARERRTWRDGRLSSSTLEFFGLGLESAAYHVRHRRHLAAIFVYE
jgi:hypothetical protein